MRFLDFFVLGIFLIGCIGIINVILKLSYIFWNILLYFLNRKDIFDYISLRLVGEFDTNLQNICPNGPLSYFSLEQQKLIRKALQKTLESNFYYTHWMPFKINTLENL